MRPIFLLSFVASAYALQDTFPSDPIGDLTVAILYSDQTGAATAWVATGDNGVCTTGTKQSPIDIKVAEAKIPTVDPGMPMLNNFSPKQSFSIDFGPDGTDGAGLAIYQTNFGIDSADFGVPILTGGPLDAGDSYNFVFGEFKWHYTTDTLGSEHSIDGTFAPLELQLVHLKSNAAALTTTGSAIQATTDWNTRVKAVVAAAVPDPSAVAVVNYQFEIDTVDNPALADIITALEAHALGTAEDITTYNMSALLNPANTNMLEDYYYYDGSLTMPTSVEADIATMGCNEIVRWIIPTVKLKLSKSQLTAIRTASSPAAIQVEQGNSLARSIQTNANTVYHRKKPTSTDIWKSLATSLLSVGTFGLVHTFLTQPDTAKALTENPIVDVLADFEQRFVNPTAAASQRSAPNHHHHTPQF